jgi:hypothetical protein
VFAQFNPRVTCKHHHAHAHHNHHHAHK